MTSNHFTEKAVKDLIGYIIKNEKIWIECSECGIQKTCINGITVFHNYIIINYGRVGKTQRFDLYTTYSGLKYGIYEQ